MSVLAQVDLGLALAAEEHTKLLAGYQDALSQLARRSYVHKQPAVIVFEGWEATGQGNVIKRLTEALDPRLRRLFRRAAGGGRQNAPLPLPLLAPPA